MKYVAISILIIMLSVLAWTAVAAMIIKKESEKK